GNIVDDKWIPVQAHTSNGNGNGNGSESNNGQKLEPIAAPQIVRAPSPMPMNVPPSPAPSNMSLPTSYAMSSAVPSGALPSPMPMNVPPSPASMSTAPTRPSPTP